MVASRVDRLAGIELEYDAGLNNQFNEPQFDSSYWDMKSDGSLSNGKEMVLKDPIPFNELANVVTPLSMALKAARTYVSKRCGFHVHVSAPTINKEQAWLVARVYMRYYDDISKLHAPSRYANSYCGPITVSNADSFYREHHITELGQYSSRASCKSHRLKQCISFCYLGARRDTERTIEFRQGSGTTQDWVVVGWAALCAAIVHACEHYEESMELCLTSNLTFDRFIDLLENEFRLTTGLVQWCQERVEYLHKKIDDDVRDIILTNCIRPTGFLTLSNRTKCNHSVLKRAVDELLAARKLRTTIVSGRTKYISEYSNAAKHEVNIMLGRWILTTPQEVCHG
jgi:hypothetical protein